MAEDGVVGAIHRPHAFGEAHVVEASDHLLRVDEADEAVGQDILDDQTQLLDSPSGCGLAHIELVGNIKETARGGQRQDSDGHPLLWTEGWLYADGLVHDVGSHLGSNVNGGGLAHLECLDSLFIIPGV
ncbi:hypothetical protein Y1Q_0020882 [Alligator mississippiensis]|uniref:Uncharacterized protein n=1 Tax=Alligator mississippiensis TaxID=8496 RepID=A0A151NK19_ALLMI|nr:hypothetical protein Y1Q_0020882 [Alligator mississippiensis]